LEFYVDTLSIRSSDVCSQIEKLKYACMSPKNNHSHLLLGHWGCGKSTELNKFIQDLNLDSYPVHKINCKEEIDIYNIDKNDILLLISNALIEIAIKNKIKIPKSLVENIYNFFKETVVTTEDKSERGLSIEGGAKASTSDFLSNLLNFFVKVKGEIKYGTSKRIVIREKLQNNVSDWLQNINEVKDIIVREKKKLPILIFEDIDKISNPKDALDIFNNSILSNFQFPVIFTFPISVAFSSEFTPIRNQYNIHFLPIIKTHDKDNKDYNKGIDVIREIIFARAEKSLFDDKAITLLIQKTGGCLRDIFSRISTAAFRAYKRNSDIIETEDIERALLELQSDLRRTIIVDDYEKLLQIYKTKKDIDDTDKMLKYLQSQVVFEYNGDQWFDVHPLIFDFVDERIKALSSKGIITNGQ
jgi:arsenate reductase-like glutaredoxin family protein